MLFATSCPTCLLDGPKLNVRPAPQGGEYFEMPLSSIGVGEIGEDFITVCECGEGHRFRVTSPPMRQFEVLGHAGIDAFVAGYFGETVMDLMAAVERAYECFCQVIHFSNGGKFSTFDSAWKSLGKLSERRLGWFSSMWLQESGRQYELPERLIKLRNNVVHNGELPSRKQSAEFGEWAVSVLFDICEHLKSKHSESLTKHHFHYATLRRERVMKRVNADPELKSLPDGGCMSPSIFGLNALNYPRKTFAQAVEHVSKPSYYGINPKGAFRYVGVGSTSPGAARVFQQVVG